MRTKNKTPLLYWAVLILWMGVIFCLSGQPAENSGRLSGGITEVIIKAAKIVAPGAVFDIEVFDHAVRKTAHFLAYLVLGLLAISALRQSGANKKRGVVIALLICVIYAAIDEAHQAFVPGRSAEVGDIILDSIGAASGIGLYLLYTKKIPGLIAKIL